MTLAPNRTGTTLDRAVERAASRMLELQHPDGWWVGELESNATMIAQHLFWHHFLGLRTPELDRKIANELLARQRDDGTWAIWFEGPPDLSTTIEAYAALKLAGAWLAAPWPPTMEGAVRSGRAAASMLSEMATKVAVGGVARDADLEAAAALPVQPSKPG